MNLDFDFESNSKKPENLQKKENYSSADFGKLSEIKGYTAENKDLNLKIPSKIFLKHALDLTGAEISLGVLACNTPYISNHIHKENEEIYIVLSGSGAIKVENDEIDLKEGTIVKVAKGKARSIKSSSEDMTYICIQVKQNSLSNYTLSDAKML